MNLNQKELSIIKYLINNGSSNWMVQQMVSELIDQDKLDVKEYEGIARELGNKLGLSALSNYAWDNALDNLEGFKKFTNKVF